MTSLLHAHPCNFHLHRVLDRGWGELACEYRWDSTGGLQGDAIARPDLARCFLFEITTYTVNEGAGSEGWYLPPDPPFVGWKFRDPTDGRSGPVGAERFSADQGWAWDRHKMAGRLLLPTALRSYTIRAMQQYYFHCEECGLEAPVPGPHSGPHTILRTFALGPNPTKTPSAWRYSITKHATTAWLDLDRNGCVGDSAQIGFGPAWL